MRSLRPLPALALVFLLTTNAQAQIQAVTSTGETVILYEGGKWEYTSKDKDREPLTNAQKFKASPEATFLVKSTRTGYGIYIDPKKIKFEKKGINDDPSGEYSFAEKEGAFFAMMLTEKAEYSFDLMKMAALANAKKAAPDAWIMNEEFRIVNDTKVMMLQLTGTIEGTPFTYFGYYFTGESGTIQLLTFTTGKGFERQKKEMEKFLNGLMILPDKSAKPMPKM